MLSHKIILAYFFSTCQKYIPLYHLSILKVFDNGKSGNKIEDLLVCTIMIFHSHGTPIYMIQITLDQAQ